MHLSIFVHSRHDRGDRLALSKRNLRLEDQTRLGACRIGKLQQVVLQEKPPRKCSDRSCHSPCPAPLWPRVSTHGFLALRLRRAAILLALVQPVCRPAIPSLTWHISRISYIRGQLGIRQPILLGRRVLDLPVGPPAP